jgi:CheY-like chemotaxis protein
LAAFSNPNRQKNDDRGHQMAPASEIEIPMTLSTFQLAARGIFHDPPAKPAVCPDSIRPAAARRQPVILLIDDDPAVLESLSRVLASEGMTTVTAANGCEGIERLGDCLPDVVITDLCMAGINGWDVLFYERMERPDLPIFVITGLAARDTGGADRFASAFFPKPLDVEALVTAVRHELEVGELV